MAQCECVKSSRSVLGRLPNHCMLMPIQMKPAAWGMIQQRKPIQALLRWLKRRESSSMPKRAVVMMQPSGVRKDERARARTEKWSARYVLVAPP